MNLKSALRLYLLADTGLVAPERLPEIVAAALQGGATCVQLRAKQQTTLEQIQLARQLLRHKADVNAKDRYGWTALRRAAVRGHEAVVQLLLDRGADLTVRDEAYNVTPLGWALYLKKEPVAELLRRSGATR